MTRRKYLPGILILALIFASLAGCSGASPQELYATMTALATPTPPPGAIDIAATMVMVQIYAEATQQSANLQAEAVAAQFTATHQALEATYAVRTAEASAEFLRQTQAAEAAATQRAEQTAYPPTATAFAWTQTAIPTSIYMTEEAWRLNSTADAARVYAEGTAQWGNNEGVALAVERQRTRNLADAVLPWTLVIIAIGAVIFFLSRSSKVRVQTTETGETDIIILEGDKGEKRVFRPALMHSPVIDVDGKEIRAPQLTDPQIQADVTRRAQAVDAIKNMPNNPVRQAANMMAGFGTPGGTDVQVVNGQPLLPILQEADTQIVDEEE